MDERSYEGAVEALTARTRRQRSTAAGTVPPGRGPKPDLSGEAQFTGMPSIFGMKEWLAELGHSAEDVNRLNIIHVAGTKGKGSTCAFIESFLRVHGQRTGFPRKIGLYTGPHLIYPEERIRINFELLSRPLFAKYFFEVEDILSKGEGRRPRYLQLYFLFALHTFIREGVDVAIIETHHGGEFDSTNVVEKPIVTCITTLGLDHIQQLGSSMESIAWHKTGIFKPGTRAVAAPAVTEAADMIRTRAAEKNCILEFVEADPKLPLGAKRLEPDVLRTNCSVAITAAWNFIVEMRPVGEGDEERLFLSNEDVVKGIEQWSWRGRFQIEREGPNTWYLDGAHNEISLTAAAQWFLSHASSSSLPKVLIFAQITKVREGRPLIECLALALKDTVNHVIFTTYQKDTSSPLNNNIKDIDITALCYEYLNTWKDIAPNTDIRITSTVDEAISSAREVGGSHGGVEGVHCLVTGSQYLVGPALLLVNPALDEDRLP